MSLGHPAYAYMQQDHLAHIQGHLMFGMDANFGANPFIAPQFLPNAIEHVLAFAPSGPPLLMQPPMDIGALLGGTAVFNAFASGLPAIALLLGFWIFTALGTLAAAALLVVYYTRDY